MSWEKILKGDDDSEPPEDERLFDVRDILGQAQTDIHVYIGFGNNSNIENMGFKKWLEELIDKLQGIPTIVGTDESEYDGDFSPRFKELNKSD